MSIAPDKVLPDHELAQLRARVAELEAERDLLVRQEREERDLAEVLRDIAGTLNSSLSLADVFDRILSQLLRLVPYDAANVILLTESSDALTARIVREQVAAPQSAEFENIEHPFTLDDLY